jgi:hypothetical protein
MAESFGEEGVMVRYSALATIYLLLGLGTTTVWAGRGDLDTSYGTNGRLTAATIFYDPSIRPATDLVATNMPDDRLITFESGLIRRFDSEGRVDRTFGDNGEIAFPLPACGGQSVSSCRNLRFAEWDFAAASHLLDDRTLARDESPHVRLERLEFRRVADFVEHGIALERVPPIDVIAVNLEGCRECAQGFVAATEQHQRLGACTLVVGRAMDPVGVDPGYDGIEHPLRVRPASLRELQVRKQDPRPPIPQRDLDRASQRHAKCIA